MIEQNKMDAQGKYDALRNAVRSQQCFASAEAVTDILESVAEELFVYGQSVLLNTAFGVCCSRYGNGLRDSVKWLFPIPGSMSLLDGMFLILLTGDLTGGRIQEDRLAEWLPYFGLDYSPMQNKSPQILNALNTIQKWIVQARKARYRTDRALKNEREARVAPALMPDKGIQLIEQAKEEAERIRKAAGAEHDRILSDAAARKKEIVDEAVAQRKRILRDAEDQQKRILEETAAKNARHLEDVRREAERILSEARKGAARLETDAQKRASALTADVLAQRHAQEQQTLMDSLSQVMQALESANARMREMEQNLCESNTRKVSRQLLEIYDILADLRDSARNRMEDDHSGVHANTAHNMNMLLMLVEDALSEYGITAVLTPPGQAFSGKIHDAKWVEDFDPKTAVVERSLRAGFVWDGRTIRKERVMLTEGADS